MQETENIRLYITPKLDAQRREHVEILFGCDPRVIKAKEWKKSDWTVIDGSQLIGFPEIPKGMKLIVLNLGDVHGNHVGLREQDHYFRHYVRKQGAILVYLQCEVEPTDFQPGRVEKKVIWEGDEHHIVLTLPMGYIAGSKINLHFPDNDTSAFHRYHISSNPRNYEYDWCWIGTESCEDRTVVLDRLERIQNGHSFYNRGKQILIEEEKARRKAVHADNKPVPYTQFMEAHRKSKVSISCNGVGMWCYKDAELFARNCFCLRQWHKNLNMNPLSPVDGKHWAVFRNEELEAKLDYYIKHDEEREAINDAGHEYFKAGMNGGWAKFYVDHLISYTKTGDKKEFGELLWKPHTAHGVNA